MFFTKKDRKEIEKFKKAALEESENICKRLCAYEDKLEKLAETLGYEWVSYAAKEQDCFGDICDEPRAVLKYKWQKKKTSKKELMAKYETWWNKQRPKGSKKK